MNNSQIRLMCHYDHALQERHQAGDSEAVRRLNLEEVCEILDPLWQASEVAELILVFTTGSNAFIER